MTWRRFCALLAGLSPESVLVRVVRSKGDVQTLDDPDAAERYFASIA